MRIPPIKDEAIHRFALDLDKELDGIKKSTLSSTTGNRSLLLQSPDLKVFEVTVTSAGALVVTKVAG
jgi:hypothetical protein